MSIRNVSLNLSKQSSSSFIKYFLHLLQSYCLSHNFLETLETQLNLKIPYLHKIGPFILSCFNNTTPRPQ